MFAGINVCVFKIEECSRGFNFADVFNFVGYLFMLLIFAARHQKMGKINNTIRSHRVYVEHMIQCLKTYSVIKNLYRHPRATHGRIVELCAVLAQKRLDFLATIDY